MFGPINPEALVQELYDKYGILTSLDYAINYIDINPYTTVDDFYYWLQSLGVE